MQQWSLWCVRFFLLVRLCDFCEAIFAVEIIQVDHPDFSDEVRQRKVIVLGLKERLLNPHDIFINLKKEVILNKSGEVQKGPVYDNFLKKIKKIVKQSPESHFIFLSGCPYGPEILKDLGECLSGKSIQRVLTGEHLWDGWQNLTAHDVDIIALPRHLQLEDVSWRAPKPKLVFTRGVPHEMTPSAVEKALRESSDQRLEGLALRKSDLVVVMLGDDMHDQQVENLARFIKILNDENSTIILLDVSRAALSGSRERGKKFMALSRLFSGNKHYLSYSATAFKPLLGLLRQKGGTLIVSSDSPDFLIECIDSQKGRERTVHIVAIHNSAVTDHQRKDSESERKVGRISEFFLKDSKWQAADPTSIPQEESLSAQDSTVMEIFTGFPLLFDKGKIDSST
jgi:hypothetical protein